jgi:hypothetical protein
VLIIGRPVFECQSLAFPATERLKLLRHARQKDGNDGKNNI